MSYASFVAVAALLSLGVFHLGAQAQGAGAGADFNMADRAKVREQTRLEKVDPPIRPDPLGNALIGGAVTGTMKGAAAGATSAIRSGAAGAAVQSAKDDIAKSKAENQRTGRGGADDPRYNPATLFKQ